MTDTTADPVQLDDLAEPRFPADIEPIRQMMAAMAAPQGTAAAAAGGQASAVPAPGIPALLGVSEVARTLGVAEADLLASLEAGDLKGRKIGATWRVTQAALNAFLEQ